MHYQRIRAPSYHKRRKLHPSPMTAFLEQFSEVVKPGDKILAPVSLRGSKKDILTTVIGLETLELCLDAKKLLPPASVTHSQQYYTDIRSSELHCQDLQTVAVEGHVCDCFVTIFV